MEKNTNAPAGAPGGALPASSPPGDTVVDRINSHGYAVARTPRPRRRWPRIRYPQPR